MVGIGYDGSRVHKHSYHLPGEYLVTVTAINVGGEAAVTASVSVLGVCACVCVGVSARVYVNMELHCVYIYMYVFYKFLCPCTHMCVCKFLSA